MTKVYNPFNQMTFDYDKCFLCGKELNSNNSTVEHVFPKWLQHKFDLWNKKLILLNGSEIQYKNLTIPCCKNCNNNYLSNELEKKIQDAVNKGYCEFKKLDENIIARWLIKLSYGMLFKELSLKENIRDKNSKNILNEEILKEFKVLFAFLQTIRFDTNFIGTPWSILIFKIKSECENIYDARDEIIQSCYFMRMNDIGIVAHLQDGGYSKEFFLEHMSEFLNIELESIQFREICAKFLYKSSLFNRSPSFIFSFPDNESNKCSIITQSMGGNVFSNWNQKRYAELLEIYWKPWNIRFDEIYNGDNSVLTFLYNEDGSIKK